MFINKSTLIFIIALLINYSGNSQLNTIETDEQIVRRLIMRGADLPPDMTDSPYDNEAYQLGKIVIRDSIEQNAMLRYDAYRDNIEIQEQGGNYALFKRDYIRAVINGEHYGIFTYVSGKGQQKQGYFVQLTEGTVLLLKRKSKTFHYGTQGDGYTKAKPPRFKDKIDYYIQKGDALAEPIKLRKKTVLETLGNTQKANKIVKELKLNLGKVKDVIQLINAQNGTN